MMAMYVPSAWPYLLPLAVFTLACWILAITGFVTPLQIQLHRRDVAENLVLEKDSGMAPNLQIREQNRNSQNSQRDVDTETHGITTENSNNFVSHSRRTSSSRTKSSEKFDSESERTSTDTNVLSRPMKEAVSEPRGVERTQVVSQSDTRTIIDMDDEEDEDEDDDEEEVGFVNESRRKKDANSMRTAELRSLQQLAELATISNPDLGFINLITPNPDLDITIEVVGEEEDEEDFVAEVENRLPGHDKTPRRPRPHPPSPPHPGREKEKRKGKGRKHNKLNNRKSTPNPITTSWNTSSYLDSTLFHLIRQTGYLAGTSDSRVTELGEWGAWSPCSASCGGGKTERARSCGVQCRATETQECNKNTCADSYTASEASAGRHEGPSVAQQDHTVGAVNKGFSVDVVDEIDQVIDNSNFDSCEEWMQCRSEQLVSYLSRLDDLPSCPCALPSNVAVVWDRQLRRHFYWAELDPATAHLDVYKPTAAACIQSLLPSSDITSLAAQQCCYDNHGRLITWGEGAGTPQLISPEVSPELNYKIDVLPWIICKGDWTRYNRVRPPNNGRECRDNPDLTMLPSLVEEAMDF